MLRPPRRVFVGPKDVVFTGRTVDFRLHAAGARKVALAGTFNGWEPHEMEHGKDDIWRLNLRLPAGCYEYKFLIDGKWMEDPHNDHKVSNPHGTHNSIRLVP